MDIAPRQKKAQRECSNITMKGCMKTLKEDTRVAKATIQKAN
jgi:hypothetical protein